MKIKAKIVGGFLLLILLVGTVGYLNYTNIKRIDASFDSLVGYHTPAYNLMGTMKSEALTIFSSSLKFEFIKNEIEQTKETQEKLMRERILMSQGKERFQNAVQNYNSLSDAHASADEKEFARIIGKKWAVFIGASDAFVSLKERGGESGEIISAKQDLQDAEESLIDTINSVLAYEERVIKEENETANTLVKNTLISTVMVLIITLLSALGTGLLISASIVGPITQLKDAAEEISRGNLNMKIEVKSGDEIEALARSFNRMVEDVKYSKESLEGRARELEESKKTLENSVSELQKSGKFSAKEKVSELKKKIDALESEVKKYEGA